MTIEAGCEDDEFDDVDDATGEGSRISSDVDDATGECLCIRSARSVKILWKCIFLVFCFALENRSDMKMSVR